MKLSVTLLFASLPLTAFAQDYPTFRGANRDGHSPDTGLAKEWPAGGPALAWTAKGLGGGYGGVSTLGDKLFVLGDEGADTFLRCLGAADGKVVWSSKVGEAHTKGNPDWKGNRATPTTDGKVIVVLGAMGDLVCFDMAGKETWRKNLHKDFGGSVGSWKYSESPLIDGDHVVCVPGGDKGAVLALKKDSGEKVWQSAELTDGAEYPSLVPAEIGGTRQYIVLTMNSVAGIAAKDGKVLWKAPFPGKTAVCTSPIIKDDVVFTTCSYGVGHVGYKITASGASFSAAEIYKGKDLMNHHGGVILVGEHLFGLHDNGLLVCMEIKTGKVVWKTERGQFKKGSLAYADGLLVARDDTKDQGGMIRLVEISPSGFKAKGSFEQPDRSKMFTWPHPTIAGGKMYIRDQDTLLCYSVKK